MGAVKPRNRSRDVEVEAKNQATAVDKRRTNYGQRAREGKLRSQEFLRREEGPIGNCTRSVSRMNDRVRNRVRASTFGEVSLWMENCKRLRAILLELPRP